MAGPVRIAVLEDASHEATITDRGLMSAEDKAKLDGMFMGTRAIQAGDITATHYDFAVGFAPGKWIVQFRSASGLVLDGVCTDTVAVNGGTNLRVSLAGGGAPALIATDVVTVIAFA